MLTVTDFTKLDVAGVMFRVIDGDRQGCLTCPKTLIEADKNVVREMYGDYFVEYFEIISKRVIAIYIKKVAE